jgi:hypothetical protein
MRILGFAALLSAALGAAAQDREIQRAVVERDQMTAQFAAQVSGGPADLGGLHARQLSETLIPLAGDPALARQFLPYQRARMEEERTTLRFAPPVRRSGSDPEFRVPLALPGRPRSGVDPVAPHGLGR